MQEIFSGNQVKILDAEYLQRTSMSSYLLMERAAQSFVDWFLEQKYEKSFILYVAIGSGNNGGDGLAIARLLKENGYDLKLIILFDSIADLSSDTKINFDLISKEIDIYDWKNFLFQSQGILIDAFLGVGLKGNLRQSAKERIEFLNRFEGEIISVDMPSGLYADEYRSTEAVKASKTVTFQFPKLALLAPDYAEFCGELVVLDIGITTDVDSKLTSNKYFLQEKDLMRLHKKFNRFSYKGDFGKCLIIGGSPGKMGALFLACKSALRTGAGLVTCYLDELERTIIQGSVPEAMCTWGSLPEFDQFHALAIGPGWGTDNRISVFERVLKSSKHPLVLDADALNLLAQKPSLIKFLPKNSILTPHLGEFKRLVGDSTNYFERIKLARDFAINNALILVLKGANTVISLPDGRQIFNSSGTHYMATAGAGDVLTGMIVAFLGMGYLPENAALCAVYHHGLAGEIASKTKRRGLIASDIIDKIPETYLRLNIS
ncbi:MAG: NAD(P)H-hydrate dehydratase [Algoriphagus sp.]|uniref:NAD(P)H-hydrate dehydratase n=1 Tax=Algoriphagus sp. TaxID=1872435 RepID=UPI00260CFF28|nr:NAD(P)H-hydrate dehydratase [Algoriphagus sp.]MDG1276983.1 NAD(P)H-hydrate dehydratase [Algoriphagus sp.]